MAEGTYVVIDLETTGLDPLVEGILEIAAVRLEGGQVVASWQTLVNPGPGVELTEASRAIHGITAEMVADAPSVPDALEAFLAFLGDAPVVAHNAPFDLAFLNRALGAKGAPPLANEAFDTLEMAREVFPEQRSHKLEALCRLLGHEAVGFHRAAADAGHLAVIFPRLHALWAQKRAWYRSQFPQIEHLARRYDHVTRLIEALQVEAADVRRVLSLYFQEHPATRIPLPGGEALLRITKEQWEYDLAVLLPQLEAWGLKDRFLKLDRQRLDRWLQGGRFDEAQRSAIASARVLQAVTQRIARVGTTTAAEGDAPPPPEGLPG